MFDKNRLSLIEICHSEKLLKISKLLHAGIVQGPHSRFQN